jgi:hypothetical protein
VSAVLGEVSIVKNTESRNKVAKDIDKSKDCSIGKRYTEAV